MLGDNIKKLRKSQGYSQEELAIRLNVVRQTVSKWEKNLSVPDSEMLMKISEVLEVSVSELLGDECSFDNANTKETASYLERINEQLAIRNRRSKTIIKIIVGVIIGIIVLNIIWLIMGGVAYVDAKTWVEKSYTQIIE